MRENELQIGNGVHINDSPVNTNNPDKTKVRNRNKFIITISFSSKENDFLGKHLVDYPRSNNPKLKDEFVFYGRSIKITATRCKRIDIDNVLYNANNGLHHQITKALAYYYTCMAKPKQISKINISRYIGEVKKEDKTIPKDNIRQIMPKDSNIEILTTINRNELKNIFNENKSGASLLISVTHLIKSLSSKEPFEKFELLWKCFNSIYKLKESSNRDADCLICLRTHMIDNTDKYSLSTSQVRGLSSDNIFLNINWREMILNDYPRKSNVKEFVGFIERINDIRIIKKIEESLTIREAFLKENNLADKVMVHIENRKNSNCEHDIEVVALICLKYLYFARNKQVHAEKTHHGFRVTKQKSNEETKIDWCCEVLIRLIIDLFNFNSEFNLTTPANN